MNSLFSTVKSFFRFTSGAALLGVVGGYPISALCAPEAYETIGKQHNIPGDVLYAIALTESGRHIRIGNKLQKVTWPWTLNISGFSHYYNDKKSACTALRVAVAAKKQVDIGFMQVNWIFNGRAFVTDPCQLLNPWKNIEYGAQVLARERRECGGDIFRAIGTYHTGSDHTEETAKRAMKYRVRVAMNYNRLKKLGEKHEEKSG